MSQHPFGSLVINSRNKNNFGLAPYEKERIYDTKCSAFKPVKYTGEITEPIKTMLSHLNNLFKLGDIAKNKTISIKSHTQPGNDDNQDIRCYISGNYIVVELRVRRNGDKEWLHVIEHHSPDDIKDLERFYNFKIVPGLENDEFIEKINEGLEAVILTIEVEIHNKTIMLEDDKTIIDQMKNFTVLPCGMELETVREYSNFMQQQIEEMNEDVQRQLKNIDEEVQQRLEGTVPQQFQKMVQQQLEDTHNEIQRVAGKAQQRLERNTQQQADKITQQQLSKLDNKSQQWLENTDKEIQQQIEGIVQHRLSGMSKEVQEHLEDIIQQRLKKMYEEIPHPVKPGLMAKLFGNQNKITFS